MKGKSLINKFKLGRHHAMERFGILILVLTLMTTTLLGFMGQTIRAHNQETLGNQAIYTQGFRSSLTGIEGSVVGAYRNEKKTDFFLLLKFNDMSKLSTDANQYQMFMTGARTDGSRTPLQATAPAGMIYMFGSTGYMGIHITSTQPFPEQVMHVVVRNNYMMTPKTNERISEATIDDTFVDNDQFLLLFNPAGNNAKVVEFLDKEKVTGFDMFNEMLVVEEERAIKAELNKQLELMFFKQLNMKEFAENRLVKAGGLQVPKAPAIIANDVIVAKRGDEVLQPSKTQEHSWMDKDEKIVDPSEITYYLTSKEVVTGGYMLDWQTKSVHDGFIKDVYQGDTPWVFLDENKNARNDGMKLSDMKYFRSNGDEFKPIASGEGHDATLSRDIQLLQNSWTEYYELKTAYQRTLMDKLLRLELRMMDVSDYWTVNQNPNVLLTY